MATADSDRTLPKSALWHYGDVTLEVIAQFVKGEQRYRIPTDASEGWGHVFLKLSVVTHLLQWGYDWDDIKWEHALPGSQRYIADIFASKPKLPSFWFECGWCDSKKLGGLRAAFPNLRIVTVTDYDFFINWWNGRGLSLKHSLSPKERRRQIRKHRAKTTVQGIEYWAIYHTSTSCRVMFAVRRDGEDHYTYLDSGEGWSLSNLLMLSRRTDTWTPLIPEIANGDLKRKSKYDNYLARKP